MHDAYHIHGIHAPVHARRGDYAQILTWMLNYAPVTDNEDRAVKCDVMSLDNTVATIALVPHLLRLEPLLVVLTHGWRVWSSFSTSFVQHRNYIFLRRHER